MEFDVSRDKFDEQSKETLFSLYKQNISRVSDMKSDEKPLNLKFVCICQVSRLKSVLLRPRTLEAKRQTRYK